MLKKDSTQSKNRVAEDVVLSLILKTLKLTILYLNLKVVEIITKITNCFVAPAIALRAIARWNIYGLKLDEEWNRLKAK